MNLHFVYFSILPKRQLFFYLFLVDVVSILDLVKYLPLTKKKKKLIASCKRFAEKRLENNF